MSSFIIHETPVKKSKKINYVIPETPQELSQIDLSPISISSSSRLSSASCATTVYLSNHSTVDLSGSDRGSSMTEGELSYIEEESRPLVSYLEPILEEDMMMKSYSLPYCYEKPTKLKKISQSFSSKCYNDVPIHPGNFLQKFLLCLKIKINSILIYLASTNYTKNL